MNDDQLRTALRTSLDNLVPTTRSLEPLRTAGRRRRRLREGAAALAAVVVLGGSAVTLLDQGDDRSALQPADPGPSATALVLSPETAWDAFLVDHPDAPHSSVFTRSPASYAAYASQAVVHVMSFHGGDWRDLWSGVPQAGVDVTTVELASLTDTRIPDVVVGTSAASVVPTFVLRPNGETYAPVSFSECSGPPCAEPSVDQVANGRVIDGQFVSSYNPCTPTCADSRPVDVRWVFDVKGMRFLHGRSGVCAPGSTAVVWDVTDAVLVKGLVQVAYRVDTVTCGTVDDVIYEPSGPTMHASLTADAHVELLSPHGTPNSVVIATKELPQQLLPGQRYTFEVTVSGASVTSLVEAYHP